MDATVTYARPKERGGPVPLSTRIYQGTGTWPDTFKNFAFTTFLLFYYSQVLGIPATPASVARWASSAGCCSSRSRRAWRSRFS